MDWVPIPNFPAGNTKTQEAETHGGNFEAAFAWVSRRKIDRRNHYDIGLVVSEQLVMRGGVVIIALPRNLGFPCVVFMQYRGCVI